MFVVWLFEICFNLIWFDWLSCLLFVVGGVLC